MLGWQLETKSIIFRDVVLVTVQVPVEDVERIMAEVVGITPLSMGAYDSNAYQTATGIERYRPLAGAAAGPEPMVRKRPGTVEVSFELPPDQNIVEQVVEAIFQVHSYQEPIIRLQAVLSSRSKGLDDSANPNRWWNTTGDWKKGERQSGITGDGK
jgi:hypothetical protein